MEQTNKLNFKKSRSGRLLFPVMKSWTGERVVFKKQGVVEILDGAPDCTSTFQSERSLFKMPSMSLSKSLNVNRSPEIPRISKLIQSFSHPQSTKTPRKNVRRDLNYLNKKNGTLVEARKLGQKRVAEKNVERNFTTSPKIDHHIDRLHTDQDFVTLKSKPPSPKKQLVKIDAKIQMSKMESPSTHNTNLRKNSVNKNGEIDIFGPQFQPVVYLKRLLPEDILHLTRKNYDGKENDNKNHDLSPKHQKEKKNMKLKERKKKLESNPRGVRAKFARQCKPRTVRETQQLLSVLNKPKICEDPDEEPAFFKSSPSRTTEKQLNDFIGFLNDDCESDDNLSIRMLSERESSPMSSAVSPIGSIQETDAEMSGWEDGLVTRTPALRKDTEFQRARRLHKTLKDKEKLQRKERGRKENDPQSSNQPSVKGVRPSPGACHIFRPQVLRALEKDLKEKALSSKQWDFSAYYNGNKLQVSIGPDSDSDTSRDSLDDI